MHFCLLLLFLPLSHSSTLMEGDIIPDPGLTSQGSLGQSAALANPQRLWPGGRVYYIFDEAFSEKNREVVTSAMEYMTVTNPCLGFEDIGLTGNNRTDYVKIFNGLTCSSQLGRVGGMQQLSLNTGCLNGIRTAVHELCHTIGFLHEHTRPDRDSWVTIVEANIMDGKEENFRKREEASSAGFDSQYDNKMSLDPKDTPYDLESVLHYGPMDFSKNGQPVIKFLHDDEGRWPVAPPEDPLTTIDRVEIALTYGNEANCVVKNTDMVKYVHINRMVNRMWIDNNSKKIDNLESKVKLIEINSMKNVSKVVQYEVDIIKKNSEAKLADMEKILRLMKADIRNVRQSTVAEKNKIINLKAKQTELGRTQEFMGKNQVDLQRVIEAKQLEIKGNQLNIDVLQRVKEAQQIEIEAKQENIESLQRVNEAQQTEIKAMKGEIDGLQRVNAAQQMEVRRNIDLLRRQVENLLLPSVCRNPKILDSKTRHIGTRAWSSHAAPCGSSRLCCDNKDDMARMNPDWRGEGWYRFTGDAGTKMPESPPGKNKCGTGTPGYLTGGHPTVQGEEVDRTVLFASRTRSISKTIKVVNCGTFYVYHLVNLVCNRAYCGL